MSEQQQSASGSVPTITVDADMAESWFLSRGLLLPEPDVQRTVLSIMRRFPDWDKRSVVSLACWLKGMPRDYVDALYALAMSRRRSEGW